jgi:hypothetical protein
MNVRKYSLLDKLVTVLCGGIIIVFVLLMALYGLLWAVRELLELIGSF